MIICGEKLREIKVAERLKVSRTPVREALQRLAKEGFIQMRAHQSAQVCEIQLSEINNTYLVREYLEGLASRLAAMHRTQIDLETMYSALSDLDKALPKDYFAQVKADNAFHTAIVKASQNNVLAKTLDQLQLNVARVKWLTCTHNQDAATRASHMAIAHAIETRQPDIAEIHAQAHIRTFRLGWETAIDIDTH